jgi:type III secretion protein U
MSEKTEAPTAKRVREAREKGQVAHSKDFTQTVLIVALFGYVVGNGRNIVTSFTDMIAVPAQLYGMPFREAADVAIGRIAMVAVELTIPFLLIVLCLGVFAEMLQVGVLLAFKALVPNASKLNPVDNLKNMFSMTNLVEFVKSCLKIVFLTVLVYLVVRDALGPLMKLPLGGAAGVGEATAALVTQMLAYIALAYVAISAFDMAWQRFHWMKDLKMSKDEVKREYKEMEGDPHVKSMRRHLHQELLAGGMVDKSRKASVIVTNPTHIAVALYYKAGETPLPVVLAKAEHLLAGRIVAMAKEEGIPVMQNIPLARALLEQGQIDQYIPSELIEPVAEVLRLVQQLARERGDGGAP